MTELRRRIDPLEINLLQRTSLGMCEHRLSQRHDSLLDTWDAALYQHEIVLDLTIADEATHSAHC